VLILLLFIIILNSINIINYCNTTKIEDYLPDANSYKWYKIIFNVGETININVTSNFNKNFTIGIIISPGVQPSNSIGSTAILTADILNNTKNATVSYTSSNFLHGIFGLYLLIISLNSSNPDNVTYLIASTHNIIPYSYDQYFNEVSFPITLIFIGSFIIIGVVITIYIIKKWTS